MHKRIVAVLVMVLCLIMSGSSLASGSGQCARAIDRIEAALSRGDFPVAKLLVDFAIADSTALGCSTEQCTQLSDLRKTIYMPCIIAQITLARDAVATRQDGIAALRILDKVLKMAKTIEVKLYGLDELYGSAFSAAATQFTEMADLAESEGDLERASWLRDQAKDLMRWAAALGQPVK